MRKNKSLKTLLIAFIIGGILSLLNFIMPFLATELDSKKVPERHTNSVENINDLKMNSDANSEMSLKTDLEMTLHFLDVGQGLSILVQSNGENLLYDGGDKHTSSFLVAYLKEQGVTTIDYLISSHYDADHLAGLIGCLHAFDVKNVIGSDYTHNSNLYRSFLSAVEDNGLEVQYPTVGSEFLFGAGKFTILSAATDKGSSNENSVAIMIENGENRFLFTGDADHKTEQAMLNTGIDLNADVLSLGHHGSATSTSYDFLQAVVPAYAVISCGANNQYGHPDKDIMEKLEVMEIDVFRSDMQGTVVVTSNGIDLQWNAKPSNDYSAGNENDTGTQPAKDTRQDTATMQTPLEPDSTMVWKSNSGARYHAIPNCGRMNPDNATQVTPEQAQSSGLEECGICF